MLGPWSFPPLCPARTAWRTVAQAVSDFAQALNQLAQAFSGPVKALNGLAQGVNGFDKALNGALKGMNESLKGMNGPFKGMNESLKGMNESFMGMNELLTGMNGSLKDLNDVAQAFLKIGQHASASMRRCEEGIAADWGLPQTPPTPSRQRRSRPPSGEGKDEG
jgi:ABC-type transporter Mla subunit MlaD